MSDVRIFLRPLGSPLPLGFLGLAGATFVLAGAQLGWVGPGESGVVGLVLVAFAVPMQGLASVLGFLGRDVVAGTGMGLLAATWLTVGLAKLGSVPGTTSDAVGLLLFVSAAGLLVVVVSAGFGKLLASAVLATAACRFVATGLYEMTSADGWETVAGILGLLLAAVAVWAALAFVSEDSLGRGLVPTLRGRPGRAATDGTMADEVSGVQHEAGVRRML
ncbi:hypothetical protein WDH52_16095 [Streptomyces sp. TRM70308]|uniref:hypothetical protein n=1 Tax=Streptomyces TaxID=1883 RepID=UPI00224962BB|nr:hypothetical protein [Streptomyces sp. JHD 1]MCX2968861.1 hypothetical protein [Streptomyces sp. JHD 1]